MRWYDASRTVAGSIPDEITSFFNCWSFQLHYDPGVASASNRNDYQECSWEWSAPGALRLDNLNIICESTVSLDVSQLYEMACYMDTVNLFQVLPRLRLHDV
jgi:hypothetical protein